jgi:hypothetical protein
VVRIHVLNRVRHKLETCEGERPRGNVFIVAAKDLRAVYFSPPWEKLFT